MAFAWLFLVFASTVTFVVGRRFRAGRNRSWLALYRNLAMPRAARNFPLVAPEVSALLLAGLVVSAPIFLDLHFDVTLSHEEQGVIVLGGLGYFFLIVAVGVWMTFKPPSWTMPSWLAAEDASMWFVSPAPDWFDRLLVVLLGLPAFVLGVGAIIWGFAQYLLRA